MKRLTTYVLIGLASILPATTHAQVTLTNPLGETDVNVIIGRVIQGFLSVSGTIALLMFIYGGLIWLTSNGNPDNIKKGKKILVWAILGIVVIASAYVITNTILNALLTGEV